MAFSLNFQISVKKAGCPNSHFCGQLKTKTQVANFEVEKSSVFCYMLTLLFKVGRTWVLVETPGRSV